MDITPYRNQAENEKIYYGKVSIVRDFWIANADEYGYKYLGANSCYPFTELIHPDDRESFLFAADRLDHGIQSVVARIKSFDGQYRCLCLTLEHNGRVIDGFRSFDISYTDILTIHENYEKYTRAVGKYRKFLSMMHQLYYEYKLDSGEFVIYKYHNEKSIHLFKGKLTEFRDEVMSSGRLASDLYAVFDKFYNSLLAGAEQFEENMPAVIFAKKYEGILFEVKSTTVYKNDLKEMIVGVMNPTQKVDDEKYYMTEAAKDAGTGLLNKKAISEYAIEKIYNYEKGFYLLLMDVDDFKNINDTYGHMFGDEVLVRVSEIIRSVLSSRGTVGRFGGDEFLMVIENVNDEEELRRLVKTISKHIQWAFAGVPNTISITTSAGIVKFPEDGASYEELFNKADKSLYIAKAKGKNRFIIYDEKKHGMVKQSDKRIIGSDAAFNNEKKVAAVSEIIMNLHTFGADAIIPVFSRIQKYFDIDGIAVYSGASLERTYSIGKYIHPIENFTFFECPDYRRFFNANGTYAETNIRKIERVCATAFESYNRQETTGFVQCAVFSGTKVEALISFDVFGRKRKWSDFEIDFLTVMGKLVCSIIIKEIYSAENINEFQLEFMTE